MLKLKSGGDGSSSVNWVRFCDTCKAAACTVYDHTASAYLCNSCDERVRAANSLALSTEHGWIHSANALPHQHIQAPMPHFSGLESGQFTTYLDELPSPMLEPENEIMTYFTEEIDEEETDSCLLLDDPDNNDNQSNNWLTNGEEVEKSSCIKEHNSCSQYGFCRQNNQQQIYRGHQGDSGSDGVVPVQEDINNCSSSSNRIFTSIDRMEPRKLLPLTPLQVVLVSFINAGIFPEATISGIPSSDTRYPNMTTNFFPNISFPMPLEYTPMNREAKVLRYREKRKARKLEKKIRYASRKAYAEARPRVKGRFARKTEMDFEVDQMFPAEDYGYGIVPSY